MAVTTPDTVVPGKLLRYEPLDFDVTTSVTEVTISIEYASGAWDMVYQDGRFAAKFAGSSVVGSHFTIVPPRGGWPEMYYARVKEIATVSGGQALGVIYEVDFTALASQSLPQGALTVDGKVWYAKAPSVGPFGSNIVTSLVHGQGLVFDQTNGSTGNHLNSGAVSWDYRHLFMPLAQLADYNPLAPLLVRFHGSNGPGGSMGLVGGLCSSTNDGVALAGTDRQYDYLITGMGSASSSSYVPGEKRGINPPVSSFPAAGSPQLSLREAGVYRFMGRFETGSWGPENSWSGAFTAVDNLILATVGGLPPVQIPARPNTGVVFGVDGQTEVGPCVVTHMQILQPKAP